MKDVFKNMHWAARFAIKCGSIISLFTLLSGFFHARGSALSVFTCSASVYTFAVSIIGGLLLDVTAERSGIRKKD